MIDDTGKSIEELMAEIDLHLEEEESAGDLMAHHRGRVGDLRAELHKRTVKPTEVAA